MLCVLVFSCMCRLNIRYIAPNNVAPLGLFGVNNRFLATIMSPRWGYLVISVENSLCVTSVKPLCTFYVNK